MNYEFPVINNIEEVLPHIDDNFRVIEKEGLTFINYNILSPETFPPVIDYGTAVRRECRGIAFFSDTGKIASRPFHKFFNLGEREDEYPGMYPSGDPSSIVLEKLDGSMIRPLPYKEGLRWGTKAGITDVGMMAEEFIADKLIYKEFAEWCIKEGRTPIFEYISPDNRIVLKYEEEVLVLLAVRFNVKGTYISRDDLAWPYTKHLALGIPIVKLNTVENIKEAEDVEGIVMVYPTGHRLKVKSDWYVKAHRAKELIDNHRKLIGMMINNELDDIKPLLLPEDRIKVEEKEKEFWDMVDRESLGFGTEYNLIREQYPTKKDFAVSSICNTYKTCNGVKSFVPTLAFRLWDGKVDTPKDAIVQWISKQLSSVKKFEAMKEVIGL